ncbi:preprotein translocase subunit SecE [Candidatus Microgenomates bacterium]|nr:preprotein translocase subunit SecE [Candidatus Microgenomates bacterium]
MATKAIKARPQFASSVMDELKKVTWPTRQETIRLTIVVIAISLIIAFYIGIIDVLLAKALELLTTKR